MHGIIFSELRKFVVSNHDDATWGALLQNAGLGGRSYMPLLTYPDEEVVSIVRTASEMTSTPVPVLLEGFGHFIAPGLMNMYRSLLKPGWRALDVIEHAEGTIHRVVRMRNAGAEPPYLEAVRLSPGEVQILYTSQRRLCHVAKGIARGIADHFGERVQVSEGTCMHRGDARCDIRVRQLA
jgi:hypothetical protein